MVEWSALAAKFIGALTGSSIAVALKTEGDTKSRLLKKLGVGIATGMLFASALLTRYELPHTLENLAASAGLLGIFGYAVWKIALSDKLDRFLSKFLPKGDSKND